MSQDRAGQGQLWTDNSFIFSNFRRQKLVGTGELRRGSSLLSVPDESGTRKWVAGQWIEMTNGGSSTNVEVYFNKMWKECIGLEPLARWRVCPSNSH